MKIIKCSKWPLFSPYRTQILNFLNCYDFRIFVSDFDQMCTKMHSQFKTIFYLIETPFNTFVEKTLIRQLLRLPDQGLLFIPYGNMIRYDSTLQVDLTRTFCSMYKRESAFIYGSFTIKCTQVYQIWQKFKVIIMEYHYYFWKLMYLTH